VCCVAAATAVANARGYTIMRGFTDGKQRWKACYLKTENIEGCDRETGFLIYPTSPDLKARLAYLKQYHLNLFAAT
jgi:hypothetical protein